MQLPLFVICVRWVSLSLLLLFFVHLLSGKAAIEHIPLFNLLIGRCLADTQIRHLWHHISDRSHIHTSSIISHSSSEKRTKRQKTKDQIISYI